LPNFVPWPFIWLSPAITCDHLGRKARHRQTIAIVDFMQNSLACVPHQSDECDRGGSRGKGNQNMKIFTIETDTNNITAYGTAKEAGAIANAEQFRNQAGLAKLAAKWPAARLVEIWNSLPGAESVKKFKDRNTAVERIWKAIQSLTPASPDASEPVVPEPATAAAEAPQTPDAAPVAAASGKKATRVNKAPKAATKAKKSLQGSKTETILDLLKRPGGVSAKELMETTGWQAHSVRGFLSGTVGKKMGLAIISTKGENGDRTYSIEG
jgi:hypothetical protein